MVVATPTNFDILPYRLTDKGRKKKPLLKSLGQEVLITKSPLACSIWNYPSSWDKSQRNSDYNILAVGIFVGQWKHSFKLFSKVTPLCKPVT